MSFSAPRPLRDLLLSLLLLSLPLLSLLLLLLMIPGLAACNGEDPAADAAAPPVDGPASELGVTPDGGPVPGLTEETLPEVGALSIPASSLVVDHDALQTGTWWKRWSSANGSYPFAGFTDKNSKVGTLMPEQWMRDNYPYFSHIRFGNFLFGHCNSPGWAADLGLEEMVNADLSPNFDQTVEYLVNVLASGIKPHIALTGTPLAVAGSGWKCATFGHVATFPAPNQWDWQDAVVKAMVDRFKSEFGLPEIQSWLWTTWTEPDCACHFLGSYDEMSKLVLMSRNVLRHDVNDIPLRLGNFIAPQAAGDASATWIAEVVKRLHSANLDFANDMNGIGLSVYQKEGNGREIPQLLDGIQLARNAASAQGVTLPIHIDELGYLQTVYQTKAIPTYKGDPTIHGASWLATMLHGIFSLPYTRNVAFWHRNLYLMDGHQSSPTHWVKLAKLNVIELLDQLCNTQRIPVTGEQVKVNSAGKQVEWISALAGYDAAAERHGALVIRHHRDPKNTSMAQQPVCFDNVENGKVLFEVYAFDTARGSAWDIHFGADDYRSHYSSASDGYAFNGKNILSLEEARALQYLDDPYLLTSEKARITQGRYCHTLTLPAHAVFLLRLTQEPALTSPTLAVDAEHSLASTPADTPEFPVQAKGVSFDRGVDALSARPEATRFSDPGIIWQHHDTQTAPVRSGAEDRRGLYFPPGAFLAYNRRPLNVANGELSCWVRLSRAPDAASTDERHLLSWTPQAGTHDLGILLDDRRQLVVRLTIDGRVFSVTHGVSAWKAHQWHHVRVSLTGSTVTLKVDDLQVGQAEKVPLDQLAMLQARVLLGGTPGGGALQGVLDEIRLK